jgi:energy-coupling factor transport system permease protein
MECRCYRGGEGRTRLNRLQMTGEDALVLALGLIWLSGLTALGRMGWLL